MITYSSIISACEKASVWQQALSLLRGLPAESIRASVITFNAAISACEKAAEWEMALHLLLELISSKLRSSEISFSSAISACHRAQQKLYQNSAFLFGPCQCVFFLPAL